MSLQIFNNKNFVYMTLLLSLSLFSNSCSTTNDKVPKDIISEEVMSKIIAEVKIIDAAYQTGVAPSGAPKSQKETVIDTIFRSEAEAKSIKTTSKIKIFKNAVNQRADSLENIVEYKPKTSTRRLYKGNVAADYQFIFEKHKVSREQFDESLEYYSKHPGQYKRILERSLEILTHHEIREEE